MRGKVTALIWATLVVSGLCFAHNYHDLGKGLNNINPSRPGGENNDRLFADPWIQPGKFDDAFLNRFLEIAKDGDLKAAIAKLVPAEFAKLSIGLTASSGLPAGSRLKAREWVGARR